MCTDARQTLFTKAFGELIAGIPLGFQDYEQRASVISRPLEKEPMPERDYFRLAGGKGWGLLKGNVFAETDGYPIQITFRSTLMRRLCEEMTKWKARPVKGHQ
jgi:hypothetical protein